MQKARSLSCVLCVPVSRVVSDGGDACSATAVAAAGQPLQTSTQATGQSCTNDAWKLCTVIIIFISMFICFIIVLFSEEVIDFFLN